MIKPHSNFPLALAFAFAFPCRVVFAFFHVLLFSPLVFLDSITRSLDFVFIPQESAVLIRCGMGYV